VRMSSRFMEHLRSQTDRDLVQIIPVWYGRVNESIGCVMNGIDVPAQIKNPLTLRAGF
jgi:hypothetical protein